MFARFRFSLYIKNRGRRLHHLKNQCLPPPFSPAGREISKSGSGSKMEDPKSIVSFVPPSLVREGDFHILEGFFYPLAPSSTSDSNGVRVSHSLTTSLKG